jgi:WXG100 family type VII secretion target
VIATYTFDFNLADETMSAMSTVGGQISSMLDDLERTVQKLLPHWTSEARDAYGVAQNAWDSAAQNMPTALSNARIALGQIADIYGGVEKQGVQMWSGQS